MTTIIDANVTTLVAAIIMFQFGSGPVKGFALTLFIGVITSVFTAVLITQVLIGWLGHELDIEHPLGVDGHAGAALHGARNRS